MTIKTLQDLRAKLARDEREAEKEADLLRSRSQLDDAMVYRGRAYAFSVAKQYVDDLLEQLGGSDDR